MIMMSVSWVIRYLAEEVFATTIMQGVGYAMQILFLFLLFFLAYRFCYRVAGVDACYISILSLALFKIAWNLFKTGSSFLLLENLAAPWSQYSPVGSLVSYLEYFLVCLVGVIIYRKAVRGDHLHTPMRLMVILAVVFVLCQMVLEFCGHVYTGERGALFLYYLCALLYSIINYAVLVMLSMLDSFRHENRSMHDFISNKMRYYEMSHDGIVTLQTKCHDLKHQIAAIRMEADRENQDSAQSRDEFFQYLDELQDSIDEYSTVVECGNHALDVVLTEKNILCYSCGVKFSYMIDGSLFTMLTDREIYSLFGNALDNALEAASKVTDPSGRMISLKSNLRGNMVVVRMENTYEGLLNRTDDLPRTTKTSSGHGFGLRSMRQIAEKHGGEISVDAEGGVFKLNILLERA